MQETWVRSLGGEDPLEKVKATHSSILAWRIPWTISPIGSQRVGHGWTTFTFTSIRRTDAKAPILWLPDAKSQLIGKDPDAGKDWGQEEKGVTEDEMFGWHHRANAQESEKTLGDNKGQGSPVCFSPWDRWVGHDLATEQQIPILEGILIFLKFMRFVMIITLEPLLLC